MPVTFRQLEIFVAASKDGNFRKTADALGISQPGLSKQIQALEAALGRRLFERRRGASAVLSADGVELLARAREMLNQQKELHGRDEPLSGRIRVSAGEYLLDYVIKPALPQLIAEFPNVEFDFRVIDRSRHISDVVRSGDADLGIALSQAAVGADEDVRILREAPCSLYVTALRAAELLASAPALAAEPLILPVGALAAKWVLDAVQQAGLNTDRPTVQVQFADVMADMIRRGEGMGVLFDEHVRKRYGADLVPLPYPPPSVPWLLVRGPKLSSPAATGLLDRFADIIGSMPR